MKRTFEEYMEEFTRPGGLHPIHYRCIQDLFNPVVEGMSIIRAHKRRKTTSCTFSDAHELTMFRD